MTPEILARIATARALRDLSDLARQEVAATAEPLSPAERIRRARRLRQMTNEIIDRVVLAEALAGASWEEIAGALGLRDPGTVEREYAEDVAEWAALPEDEMEAEAEGAEDLDAWYARHREDHDPTAPSPVTDLLNRR
ncbi:hypothetical protein [Streptomyces griseomycini]|uniref:Uncharacterized protein n=1 Tax=Streptomyces griseomycini TaxID=66895 RepID=A0A7W7PW85_9ACTN|nr:hypothetical protein [Streptomyces griseomycini]MBB4902496.1 hypothetical protein [Streptomyces griseomycini]GGR52045.1 hypothetical protein GCM10015536_66880 [Streptomyces griseomycini]